MNPELDPLLRRWREGTLSAEETRALTELLAAPEARSALRRDWFLEASLPQALGASSVVARAPRPSPAARMRAWIARGFASSRPGRAREGEEEPLLALRLWARASYAALAVGLAASLWLSWLSWDDWPLREGMAANADPDPAFLARIMIETHLPDSP